MPVHPSHHRTAFTCEPMEPRLVLAVGGFGVDLSYVGGTWDFGGSFFDYDSSTGTLNSSSRNAPTGGAFSLDFSGFNFGDMTNKNAMSATYATGATTFDNQVGASFNTGNLGYLFEWNNSGPDFRLSYFMNQATGLAAGDRDGNYKSSGLLFNDNARTPTMHAFESTIGISGNDVNGNIAGDFGSIAAAYQIASLFADGFTVLNNNAWLLFALAAASAFSSENNNDDGFRSISLGGRVGSGFTAADFEGKTIAGTLYTPSSHFVQQVGDNSSVESVVVRLREGGQAEIFDADAFYTAINSSQDPGQGELGEYLVTNGGSRLVIADANGRELEFFISPDMTQLTPEGVYEDEFDDEGFEVFGAFTVVMTGENLPEITPPAFGLTMVTETSISFNPMTTTNTLTLWGAASETPFKFNLDLGFVFRADAWAKSDGSGFFVVGQTLTDLEIHEYDLSTTPTASQSLSDAAGGTLFDSSGYHHTRFGDRISWTGFDTMGDPIRYSWTPDMALVGMATFTNIGQNLRDNGSSVPAGLDSSTADAHETQWGTLLLSAKDSSGNTINIWTTEGLIRYFTNDINDAASETQTLGGKLSVSSADYGGITITGLDGDNRLASLWWHYSLGAQWKYADFGAAAGAPAADENSISSFYDQRDSSYNHYYTSTDLSTGYNLRWKPTLDKWINYDLSTAYPSGLTDPTPKFEVAHNYINQPILYGWIGTTGSDDNTLRAPLDALDIYGIDDNGTPSDTADDFGALNPAFQIQLTF